MRAAVVGSRACAWRRRTTAGIPNRATRWQEELARVQRWWDLQPAMPEAPVLELAVERVYKRIVSLPDEPSRARALDDYASGVADA